MSSKKSLKNPHHIYIDGDMLVYKLGYASEDKGQFIDGSEYHRENLRLCKNLVGGAIKKYVDLLGAKTYTIVLSGTGNYRTEFYPEYKANRVTLVKPLCYNSIRDYIHSLPETVVVDGEEADDYLAAKMTDPTESENCLVVSADKDFFTAPGRIFNISTGRVFNITIPQSFCFLFFQALVGDRVDGYFGVKWMGYAKVKRILMACNKKTVCQTYLLIKREVMKRGKTKEEKKSAWNDFRLCLDLAALRWTGEIGAKNIGFLRVLRHRESSFEYFLPYYDVSQNVRYGVIVEVPKK